MTLFFATPINACPAYNNLRAARSENSAAAREHCEDLWRTFEPFADEHFLTQFPLSLHERWFEMYLAVSLIRAGYNVQCPKPGPDVLLTIGDQRIWIEAVCAKAGEAGLPDSVPQPQFAVDGEEPVMRRTPKDQMTLRIRNSLHVKEQKFRHYLYNNIVRPTDVTVISINVHDVPYAWVDMDELMQRSLYGLGDIAFAVNRNTRAIEDRRRLHRPVIEKQSTREPVEVQPFIDGSMAHISAVLGSREDAGNLPSRLGDGFALFPNLTATIPWPSNSISLGEEWLFEQAADGWTMQRRGYIAV